MKANVYFFANKDPRPNEMVRTINQMENGQGNFGKTSNTILCSVKIDAFCNSLFLEKRSSALYSKPLIKWKVGKCSMQFLPYSCCVLIRL